MVMNSFTNINEDDESHSTTTTRIIDLLPSASSSPMLDDSMLLSWQQSRENLNLINPDTTPHVDHQPPNIHEIAIELDHLPPISRATLRELDEVSVCSNLQIMHDLLIEPTLRIKPNTEKRRSLDQLCKSETYWTCIRDEIYALTTNALNKVKSKVSKRLQILLTEIKETLLELYPDSSVLQTCLAEHMDIDMLIKDIELGVFDVVVFAQTLQVAIKANCAPKRDVLVDRLVTLASKENIVDMLKLCLELCELMKLDLINYRLARLRPNYLKSYVEMERKRFLDGYKFTVPLKTITWLKSLQQTVTFDSFLSGVVQICCVLVDEQPIPETMDLDQKRMIGIRAKFQDLCVLASLLLVFRQWCGKFVAKLWIDLAAIERLKCQLQMLLERPETTIGSVANLIYTTMCTIIKKPPKEVAHATKQMIHRQVDQVMDPEGKIVLLLGQNISRSIREIASSSGRTTTKDTNEWSKRGLSDVKDEIVRLGREIAVLSMVNWNVYHELYENINKL